MPFGILFFSSPIICVVAENHYICTPCFYHSHFNLSDMSKILIIDDEVQIRGLLARMMELEGYEVCQAGDCKTALRQLELQMPDVALCECISAGWKRGGSGDGDEEKISGSRDYSADGTWKHT